MNPFISPDEVVRPTPRQLAIETKAAKSNARWYRHRVGEARAVAFWRTKWDMAKDLKEWEPFVFHYWLAYGRALNALPVSEADTV